MLVAGVPGAALAQLACVSHAADNRDRAAGAGYCSRCARQALHAQAGRALGCAGHRRQSAGGERQYRFWTGAKAGGVVNSSFLPAESLIGLVQGGRVRVLAALGLARNPLFPDAPTVGEEGFPNVQVRTWNGLLTPASTPPDIVRKLNLEMNAILQLPDIQEVVIKRNGAPDPCSSE